MNKHGNIVGKECPDLYNFKRDKLGEKYLGYIITRAIPWSKHLERWDLLPQQGFTTAYDKNEDKHRCSNLLVLVDKYFTSVDIVKIKVHTLENLHRFSTVVFVSGSNEKHDIAVKTEEEKCVDGDKNVCAQ